MIEIFLLILIFIMGAYFGSFYTLAVYRLPLRLDITHKHSFCPNCNHKLGILDLVPIFSYVILGGKCRYCKKKIKPRYCILECLSGLTFVLFAISLNINLYNIEVEKLVLLGASFLYFAGIFIIAGIDKEKFKIQKSVLVYLTIISVLYIVYLYIMQNVNIYRYAIYLLIIIALFIFNTIKQKKNNKESYSINALILGICMAMFTGESIFILTVIYTLISCCLYIFLYKIKNRKEKNAEKVKLPIAFFMSITNVILYISINFIINTN